MLGTLDQQQRQITIVGAGVAGLVLAEALDHAGWEVTLLEAAPRAGGLIATRSTPLGPAEAAAHSMLATQPVLDLCQRLGVELVPVRAGSRARYVWRGGKLRRFPLSISEAVRALFRAYLVLADSVTSSPRATLEQWGRRHLGEPAVKFLLTPFVRGIYGAQPAELQVAAAFPALATPRGHSLVSWFLRRWHLRLRGRSPARKGRPRMMAPAQGMGALVQALDARLRERLGDRFRVNAPVDELPFDLPNLALCVPAPEASRLLAEHAPWLSEALAKVRYTPLVSVTVFVEKGAFPAPPCGVGVLLPENTSRKSLGVLFNSSSFPGRVSDESGWVSLTAILAGTSRPELLEASDDELRAIVRSDLEALFDMTPGSSIETVIHRWPRAVPRFDDVLMDAWEAARSGWCARAGRVLFGNYTGQVSVRGMIEKAAEVAAQVH